MAHEGVSKSLQVGIFANDLCISFRIIMQELLEAYVSKIYDSAKRVAATSGESALSIFERGITSINKWDSALKDRYRSQVTSQYRNLSDLYHHIFLMYVQEMYDQSLNNVTVRVNIPSMSVMLHTFLKTACMHNTVLRGEFMNSMSFMGHVLFVETIIRRALYELLVQQNNIKSITVEDRKDQDHKPEKGRAATMSVHSASDHVLSNDLSMRQPSRKARMATPTTASVSQTSQTSLGKFWKSPTNSSVNFEPVFQSPQTSETILPHPVPVASVAVAAASAAIKAAAAGKIAARDPLHDAVQTTAFSPASRVAEPAVFSPASLVTTAPAPKPATSPVKQLVTISETHVSAAKVTSVPPPALQSSQAVVSSAPAQKLDVEQAAKAVVASAHAEFTPHKPGGKSLPEPRISLVDRNAMDQNVDSLELLPSDQDYAEEVKRLLDSNPSDTITPFDSVTNVANGTQKQKAIHTPLFF